MTSKIEARLKALNITLPPPPQPVANYLGSKVSGNLLFVSGRKSELIGAVGDEVTEEEAKIAARETIITMLAIIKQDLGNLDRIFGVEKLNGFVRSAPDFTRQPMVIDGATELLIEIWGENGKHARTATGVSQLPFGATIQLEMIMKLDTGKG